jgi:xanthosine utilization system XapX-like protein
MLGILAGEQIPPLIKTYLGQKPAAHAWLHQIRPHMFGHMPTGLDAKATYLAQARQTEEIHTR